MQAAANSGNQNRTRANLRGEIENHGEAYEAQFCVSTRALGF